MKFDDLDITNFKDYLAIVGVYFIISIGFIGAIEFTLYKFLF